MVASLYIYILSILIWIMDFLCDLLTISRIPFFCELKKYLYNLTGITIKKNFFADRGFRYINPQNISIGNNCSFGHYNKFWAFSPIEIGDYVQTALNLTIVSGGHNTSNYEPLNNQKVIIEEELDWCKCNYFRGCDDW